MELHASHDELSMSVAVHRIDSCAADTQQAHGATPWAHAYGPHALALLHYERDNATIHTAVAKWLDGWTRGAQADMMVAGDLPRVLLAVLQHKAVRHVDVLQVCFGYRCLWLENPLCALPAKGHTHAARAVGSPRRPIPPHAIYAGW